jgi:endonuclease-3 related protein
MRITVGRLYRLLYTKLGPQGWWPIYDIDFKKCVYTPRKYRSNTDEEIFEISVGAVLTQNTTWKNVEKAIGNLKLSHTLSPDEIFKMNIKKIETLIRSSGYYREKAKKLKNLSRFFLENPIHKLRNKSIQELRNILLNIKGVGKETADSIILYAFQKPIFVIDTYTKRLYLRFFGDHRDYEYDELRNFFEKDLKHDWRIYSEYHALIVEVSKRYCFKKNPRCIDCILNNFCKYNLERKLKDERKLYLSKN